MALSFCTYCNRYHDETHVGAIVLNDLRNGFVPPSPRAVKPVPPLHAAARAHALPGVQLLAPGKVRVGGRDVAELEPGVRQQVASLIAHGRNRKVLCEIASLYAQKGDALVAARLSGAAHGATVDQFASEPVYKNFSAWLESGLSTLPAADLNRLADDIAAAVRIHGDAGNALRFVARIRAIAKNLDLAKKGWGTGCSSDQTSNPPSAFWG